MMDWSIPKTVKNHRGFLVLTSYYRKFVQNYGIIATPLTLLLKKDAFSSIPEPNQSFQQVKEVRCKAHVLATPKFTKTSIVEYNA